jgi:hypothetical protein
VCDHDGVPATLDPDVVALMKPLFPRLDFARVRVVRGGPICWYVRRVTKRGAMTLAPYIFYGRAEYSVRDPRALALLAHELQHVEQVRRLGRFRFYAKYFWGLARNRFRYSADLPLEREAYDLQAAVLVPFGAWLEERARSA